MDQHQHVKLPKYQLGNVSNQVGILVCVSIATALIVLDYALGITLAEISLLHLAISIILAIFLILFQAIKKIETRRGTLVANMYLHIVVYYMLLFAMPSPSPYTLLAIGPAAFGYYTFGVRSVVISLISSGLILGGEFVVNNQLSIEKFGIFFVYYTIMVIIMTYVLSFLKIAEDEKKALEAVTRQIELERSRLLTLVNNLNDAVIACDSSFNVLLHNPKALELLGIEHSIKGRKLDALLDLRDNEGNAIKLSSLADTTQHVNVFTSYRLYYSRNDFVNLYIGINQIEHGKSTPSGYVILLRDITKVKSLEEERNEFVYIMSHELRTPVTIVEGGISLARSFVKAKDTTKALDSLEKAHGQIVILSSIVSSLSRLVNSEKAGQKTQVSEVEPQQVIEKIEQAYQQEVQNKGLKLAVHHDPDIRTIYTNQEYLFEIMQNLMTNAIKYTEEGTITLSVRTHNKSHVAFMVADTGLGISKSDQNHIFEKFWRSEDYKTRKSGGTGLGLYLTKKLADSIGARIEVDSTLGKGSTFTVYVPIYDTQEV